MFSSPAAAAEQRAILLASLLLVGFAGWCWKEWLKGPQSIAEKDVEQALNDPRREAVKRRASDPPLVKKLKAVQRRGEMLRRRG